MSRSNSVDAAQAPSKGRSDAHAATGNNGLYLLYNLIAKEFKLKYRRSVLGVVWSILNPLLMMIVMALIFSNVFRFQFVSYRAREFLCRFG